MGAYLHFWLHGSDQRRGAHERLEAFQFGVELQHDRLLALRNPASEAEDEARRRLDMHFYLVAAANVLKAAKSLNKLYGDGRVSNAIRDVEEAAPLVRRFRDMLEHFDSYDKGVGNLQGKSGEWPASRPAERYTFSADDATVEAYGDRLAIATTTPKLVDLAKLVSSLDLPQAGW